MALKSIKPTKTALMRAAEKSDTKAKDMYRYSLRLDVADHEQLQAIQQELVKRLGGSPISLQATLVFLIRTWQG